MSKDTRRDALADLLAAEADYLSASGWTAYAWHGIVLWEMGNSGGRLRQEAAVIIAKMKEPKETNTSPEIPGSVCDSEHTWEPLQGWSGRYRCTECKALGYRGVVEANILAGDNEAKKVSIIPYKCQGTRAGSVCGRAAQYSKQRVRLCFSCARARKLISGKET